MAIQPKGKKGVSVKVLLLVLAGLLVLLWVLRPAAPTNANAEAQQQRCSTDDLAESLKRFFDTPGSCLSELTSGRPVDLGDFSRVEFTLQGGEWAQSSPMAPAPEKEDYEATATCDSSSGSATVEVLDEGDESHFKQAFQTGEYCVLEVIFKDLEGKDIVIISDEEHTTRFEVA